MAIRGGWVTDCWNVLRECSELTLEKPGGTCGAPSRRSALPGLPRWSLARVFPMRQSVPVRGALRRFLVWWRTALQPARDPDLTTRMARHAEVLVDRNPSLDFSPRSLDQIEASARDEGLSDEDRWLLGCYFGEVLRRNAQNAEWGWLSRSDQRKKLDPGVVVGDGVSNPFEILERYPRVAKRHPEASLATMAEEDLIYAASPTEATAEELGLKLKIIPRSRAMERRSRRRRKLASKIKTTFPRTRAGTRPRTGSSCAPLGLKPSSQGRPRLGWDLEGPVTLLS
jgi:hypothetical protein